MKNTFIFPAILLILAGSVNLLAQNKLFTASDYLNRELYPKTITGISWRGDMDVFTYIDRNCLIQKSADNPEKADTILSLFTLNSKLKNLKQNELRQFPAVIWMDNNRFYFKDQNRIFLFDFAASTLVKANEFDSKGENIAIDENKLHVAYTVDNNLFVVINGETIQVTDEPNKAIVYGQIPSRNEFGIDAGLFWSPDGELLAFYKTDQSEVTDYPLVDIFNRIAKTSPIKYPMAGMKSQKIELGVFNPVLNEIVYLQTAGPENQYLTSVTWDPSGRYIFAGILNRDQDHFMMNKYESNTGKFVKTLFEEKNDRYVEPMHGLYFLETDPSKFIWQSRRDGWNHLYLYDTEGTMIKQVTRGEWEVIKLLNIDPQGNSVFYESTRESPIEEHLYLTELKSGKTERMTSGEGTHSIIAAKSMHYFIDVFSSTQMARAYYLLNMKGTKLAVLKEDVNPYKDYKTGEMSIFTIKADDGLTDLYCRLIKPVDFDPSKKYPALIYVYGGPHSQLINNSWTGGAGFFLNYMAQQGYVVFTLDNHGSSNRGFEFESIIHRQLGDKEIADQMAGVRYIKSLDYVDAGRIGLNGWSYGGFMTISLMLRNPGVFKVACAGGPVIDWKWYEVMYGERYMDTPMKNPEGYKRASLLNYVGNLNGKLLIIHGTNDNTVVWQNSLSFLDECIKQGKQVDYFVYPGAEHNMAGKARVHLYEKMSGYFNDYLK
ncbi:MAG: DPP IV N-terminal domain-containing protein [Bacteroidia bacterium]|nr:DPP IV N-terminal domain-containing protein [Bacteroidia bacterium]